MPDVLNELEKQVIAAVQGDMPVVQRPYLQIAENLGIDEQVLLGVLENLMNRGIIRRFGATLRHQKSGFSANAMAAWQVEEDLMGEVGPAMASFKEVSHCYRRDPTPQWPYNLYTMIHGKDEAQCRRIAERMAVSTGVQKYLLLFSRRELKKTSMKYFSSNDESFSKQ